MKDFMAYAVILLVFLSLLGGWFRFLDFCKDTYWDIRDYWTGEADDDEFYSLPSQPQVNGYTPPLSAESNARTRRTKAKRKRQKARLLDLERQVKLSNRG